MPIKSCEYDGKPGFKWGNRGKCYTYEPGDDKGRERSRGKARDQGIAIGEYFREVLDRLNKIKRRLYKKKFAKLLVSFDYDGVIELTKYQELAKARMSDGDTVIIITARNDSDMGPVNDLAKELGIDVYNTNGEDKWKKIKELGVDVHYDNNQEQIDKININTDARAIKV